MRYRLWRCAVFVGALVFPLYWLYQAWIFALGADPGKVLVERLGLGALILLLLTLAMTPLRQMTGWGGWIAIRRQLGLWCFTYALLHLAAYAVFLVGLDMGQLLIDLGERPYIIVGASALLGLLALAVTSNRYSVRALGRRWKQLHRLVYPILVLALVHMLWVVRADLREWAFYALAGTVLLLMRVPAVAGWLARLPKLRERVMTKILQ